MASLRPLLKVAGIAVRIASQGTVEQSQSALSHACSESLIISACATNWACANSATGAAVMLEPPGFTRQRTEQHNSAPQASLVSGTMMTLGDLCCQSIQQANMPPGKPTRCALLVQSSCKASRGIDALCICM